MLNVNSFQSFGAVDGPGVRFVVFLQGCNLKCSYCHNPETIENKENTLLTPDELLSKIKRYESYIKEKGGVTFSGGEPLLQAKELIPLVKLLKEEGYHIALDTNGSVLNEWVKELLTYIDLVLLDMKMPSEELYHKYIGCELSKVNSFFNYLCDIEKKVWIRQVIVEGINDTKENTDFLKNIKKHKNVEKIELLPFKKLCIEKYKKLGIPFPMEGHNETDIFVINKLNNVLNSDGN